MQKKTETPQREFTTEEKMAILNQMMPPSMEKLIQQLEELVRMALDAEHMEVKKPIPFAEIMQDLALIHKALDTISSDQESVDTLIKYMKENYPELRETKKEDKVEQRQIAKLKELGEVCDAARSRLHEQLSANPQTERATKEILEDSTATPKQKMTRRKNKFRSMGGEEWIKS